MFHVCHNVPYVCVVRVSPWLTRHLKIIRTRICIYVYVYTICGYGYRYRYV